jgi:serine/threonine protein kinase
MRRQTSTLAASASVPASSAVLASRHERYQIERLLAQGDLALLYLARQETSGRQVVLKVARSPENNDLLLHEATALRALKVAGDPRHAAFVPSLLEAFTYRHPADGADHETNVLVPLLDWVNLAEVKAAYPAGLEIRDLLWMWRRGLAALGHVHHSGLLHGALTPEHIMVGPADHGLCLVDWTAAQSLPGAAWKLRFPGGADHYPPEAEHGGSLNEAADLFMLTHSLATLFDAATPAPFRALAASCTNPAPEQRPSGAWETLAVLDQVIAEHLGPREFRPFVMPAPSAGPASIGGTHHG